MYAYVGVPRLSTALTASRRMANLPVTLQGTSS